MSALTTRDALVAAISERRALRDGNPGMAWNYTQDAEDDADHLLASGVVVDAATLADDKTLVGRLAAESAVLSSNSSRVRITLRALAAALSERSPR